MLDSVRQSRQIRCRRNSEHLLHIHQVLSHQEGITLPCVLHLTRPAVPSHQSWVICANLPLGTRPPCCTISRDIPSIANTDHPLLGGRVERRSGKRQQKLYAGLPRRVHARELSQKAVRVPCSHVGLVLLASFMAFSALINTVHFSVGSKSSLYFPGMMLSSATWRRSLIYRDHLKFSITIRSAPLPTSLL